MTSRCFVSHVQRTRSFCTSRKLRPNRPPDFESSHRIAAPVAIVKELYKSPGVLAALTPPVLRIVPILHEPLTENSVNEFDLKLPLLSWIGGVRWRAVHYDVTESDGNLSFDDVQEIGPMALWHHQHEIDSDGVDFTQVVDRIWYEHPPLPQGAVTRVLFNSASLHFLFFFREMMTRWNCEDTSRGGGRREGPASE
jgi:ligand-binding SRPBCC domain-containing protein